jgi:hypothetical protein
LEARGVDFVQLSPYVVRASLGYAWFVSDLQRKLEAGLCSECRNARAIRSERGSVFILCKLSPTDPSFPKYPRLPVLSCSGYSPIRDCQIDAKP